MEGFLTHQGLRIKDFSKFVQKQSRRIVEHAERLAENSGRPYLWTTSQGSNRSGADRSGGFATRARLCDAGCGAVPEF